MSIFTLTPLHKIEQLLFFIHAVQVNLYVTSYRVYRKVSTQTMEG